MARRRGGHRSAAQRQALRKAQLASARKRRRFGGTKTRIGVGVAVGVTAGIAGHQIHSRVRKAQKGGVIARGRHRDKAKGNIRNRRTKRYNEAVALQKKRDMIPVYTGKGSFSGHGQSVEKTIKKNQKLRRKGRLPSVVFNPFGKNYIG